MTAVTSADVQTVRGAYTAMEIVVVYVIGPLAVASVLIGAVNGLGTPWGLLRHYWVLVKLLLTVVAATVVLIEIPTVVYLAQAAASAADPRDLPGTLLHSIGGLVVLLITLLLSVFKPPGMRRYRWRKLDAQQRLRSQRATPRAGPTASTP